MMSEWWFQSFLVLEWWYQSFLSSQITGKNEVFLNFIPVIQTSFRHSDVIQKFSFKRNDVGMTDDFWKKLATFPYKLRCDIRDVYKLTKFIGSLEKGKYNKHKCKTETRLQTEFDMLSILWQASASNANNILGNLYSELY